ncbi:unnamed protein product [Gongylonema pulchrum]|uniref:EF-hand domain-containing protein n=1 Tax=Gongylonema pulchrum TaxID=637853 RepID=A0A183DV18_9BILA|nr:unnamed protein product [Gongylonema pulchrum]
MSARSQRMRISLHHTTPFLVRLSQASVKSLGDILFRHLNSLVFLPPPGNERKDPYHYTDRKVGRGYWYFSNTIFPLRPKIDPRLEKAMKRSVFIFAALLAGLLVDFKWSVLRSSLSGLFSLIVSRLGYQIKKLTKNFRPEAAERGLNENSEPTEPYHALTGVTHKEEKKKKKKVTFRERRIIEYENRIRTYSAPDKIFRYFATLKVMNEEGSPRAFEIYMTPEDFVRSLTPGIMQPRGLELDKFKIYDPNKKKRTFAGPESIFTQLDEHGLISFGDYLFLMTVLSTPPSDFALAFRIFDLNGDGYLDKSEFEKVQDLVLSQTNVGQRHRDHAAVGLYASKHINSALSCYFFGKNGDQKLSAEKFLNFQARLFRDILRIELERRDVEALPTRMISAVSFADLLLVYSGVSEIKQRKMLKRVKKKFKSRPENEVTLELFLQHFQTRQHVFYH